MMIKRILVPTDFSDCANRAAALALTLAKGMGTELLFLHLYPDPSGGIHVVRDTGALKLSDPEVPRIKAELDLLVRKAEDIGVNARGILVYDRGGDTIEQYADAYRVDLIIMGTNGISGLAEWFGGSNAQHVTRHTDVPVLIVKKDFSRTDIRNIVFASSFTENVFGPMLFITELAQMWKATVHLFYVSPAIHSIERDLARQKMQEVEGQFPDVTFTASISEINDEELAISRFAMQKGADLIALTPHERDGVLKIFSHSIAENLVNHATLPVLVLPEED